MTKIYGIKNCDTVRKALKWLTANNIDHSYHDFREDGLTHQQVATWMAELGPDKLVNKRSTSWKQISESQQQALLNGEGIDTLIEIPTLIKRPVLETQGKIHLGFKPAEYESIF